MKDFSDQIRSAAQALLAQRRRAFRVAVLAFLAGTLLYLGRPGVVAGLPVPVYTGLLYAAFVTPAAVITAIFLPGLIALSDAVQWARLGFSAAVATFPATLRPVADDPIVGATVVILCGAGLVALGKRRHLLRIRILNLRTLTWGSKQPDTQ